MPDITEGKIKLAFPPTWQVMKYDECSWHKQHKAGHGAHAMDVLAVGDDQTHWWIEIKDCEGFETDNRPRLSDASSPSLEKTRAWLVAENIDHEVRALRKKPFIIEEMLLKVRDTLAALSIAHRQAEAALLPWNLFASPAPRWTVVLLLTWDVKDFKLIAKRIQTKLNTAFKGYGINVYVVNQATLPDCGLPCTLSRLQ
ncbi:hypothetical protein GKQ23_11810 [Erwinia sp. E602]|uniref:hypothetical protein n=1 Tax=Erwinia sp. E602 TaxID=2675378 RepID=UPI001BA900D4|nr:hypothetical protein [Erwinia sp. E602]QUG75634.1 hypothetical protein GKQ23_11810 [Erwinia sp. E602]